METDRRSFLQGSLAALGVLAARSEASAQPKGGVATGAEIATFVADVTPPLGEPLGFTYAPVRVVEHPLLAKGIVLRDDGGTYVLCALDWCEIHNGSYELFRQKIASAAGTSPSRVAVQTLHQHTAPAYDIETQQILNKNHAAPPQKGLEFLEQAATQTAAAVQEATNRWRSLTHVGTSWACVDRVASSRRIDQPDGTVLTRMSSTTDPEQQRAPEGIIDGYLRTLTFFDGGTPVVRAHYYATHPQTYYRDGRVTYDVPGIARERLEKESGVFQVYFTGCGGDIGMGKYNDGTPARRPALVDRLYDAMVRSIKDVHIEPVSRLQWKIADLRFPLRSDQPFTEETCRKILADDKDSAFGVFSAAWALAQIERAKAEWPFQLSCLAIGSCRILHLPGEPFVEYQLHPQRLRPQRFIAVAGYGDCGVGYLCTNRAYIDKGGYEQTESFVGPSEELVKEALAKLLTEAESS